MVRLGEEAEKQRQWNLSMVSIPPWYDWEHFFYVPNRLVYRFQFHHGTIGRYIRTDKTIRGCDVSIPPWYDWERDVERICITSKGVSIPPWYDWELILIDDDTGLDAFQFHHGTIGRVLNRLNKCSLISFNSTMVRLGGTYS